MPHPLDESLDVIVVGAGQAGLVTGYFLQHAGVRFRLYDRAARVGDSWRQRYDSLALFSPRAYDALPDLPMRGDPGGDPNKERPPAFRGWPRTRSATGSGERVP